MNVLAAAAIPLALSNPVVGVGVGVITAAGFLACLAGFIDGKEEPPKKNPPKKKEAPSAVKKTIQNVRAMNQEIKKARQEEPKQRAAIQNATYEVKQHTSQMSSCDRNIRKVASHIEAQSDITHEHLEKLTEIRRELESTKRILATTQEALKLKEVEMGKLSRQLLFLTTQLSDTTQQNIKTSSEVITRALRIQKIHQDTIQPLLSEKNAEIQALKQEVLGLRKTLRTINTRLQEVAQNEKPSIQLSSRAANSTFQPINSSEKEKSRTVATQHVKGAS